MRAEPWHASVPQALLGAHITEAKLEHVRINGQQHYIPSIGFRTGTGLQVIPSAPCPACSLQCTGDSSHVPVQIVRHCILPIACTCTMQVQYARSDLLVDADTLLMDEVNSTWQEGGKTVYNYSLNATRLGCCSTPWAHLMGGTNT